MTRGAALLLERGEGLRVVRVAADEEVHLPRRLRIRERRLQLFRGFLLHRPGPLQALRRHPAVEDAHEDLVLVLPDEEDPRVEDPLELRVLDRLPDRLAVDGDEDGRLVGEDDPGRVVLEGEGPFRPVRLGHLQHGGEPVEGDGARCRRHLLVHDGEEGLLLLRGGGQDEAPHAPVGEGHEAGLLVHHGPTVAPHDPVERVRVGLLPEGDGRVEGQPGPVPGVDLGLVHGDDAGRGLHLARPAAVDRGGCLGDGCLGRGRGRCRGSLRLGLGVGLGGGEGRPGDHRGEEGESTPGPTPGPGTEGRHEGSFDWAEPDSAQWV